MLIEIKEGEEDPKGEVCLTQQIQAVSQFFFEKYISKQP